MDPIVQPPCVEVFIILADGGVALQYIVLGQVGLLDQAKLSASFFLGSGACLSGSWSTVPEDPFSNEVTKVTKAEKY